MYRPEHLIPAQFRRARGAPIVSENERRMLRLLWKQPGLTRAALTRQLDLTQQSVHRITVDLVTRGLVGVGAAPPPSSRGKPSPSLHLAADFAYTWGVSLNTDEIGLCLMDFAGNPIASELLPLGSEGREATLEMIAHRMRALRIVHRLANDRCLGLGFGITGFWLSGTQFNPPLPLREWSLIELGPLLSARFRLPVWIENNANTAALGEAMLGHGRQLPTFAYVSFNYGLGGSVVIDGQLITGGSGNAGEISALFTPEERPVRPALQFLLERLQSKGIAVASISDMAARFNPSWPGVDEWIDEVAPNFNRIVAAFWAVLDPQAVILGGQIPTALARQLIQRVSLTEINRYGLSRPIPKLLISELGPQASSLGAAAYSLNKCCF
ncbi:Sugar kinase of the NBD/HSP70 family, may contain an N-terminal HTH domain [Xaviernesmea oryzae]|uniref:Sugar kinase of the NBD/HSP70 family, may contain an N-terminal HTH domain n=2 Tax=Xaviernesmea oryzae TaxID=464029 RepID=A0A1X7FUG6_9HYPH|nr:Sugar kinase of the NBD/HSP70 family, may contain an N-terminal HTH domain [Xaviernesmea oryzae]